MIKISDKSLNLMDIQILPLIKLIGTSSYIIGGDEKYS